MTDDAGHIIRDDGLIDAFHGEMVPKFLATRDAGGRPNVVPIVSLDAVDDRTLVFAELFTWKTRDNLEADPRVAVAVVTEDLCAWTIRGRFREYVEGGPYVDHMNAKDIFRYNAYVGVTRVGVIDVEEVTGAWQFNKLGVAYSLLPCWLLRRFFGAASDGALPPRVAEKFARTHSVKVMACMGSDGHPLVCPTFSLVPARGASMLVHLGRAQRPVRALGRGREVAASVITMDPIAYQVKGVLGPRYLTLSGWVARLDVHEVYSASPPLAGERIELPTAS